MAINTEKLPYTVERGDWPCADCGRGGTWDVVGPDGVALGISFGDEQHAHDRADELSRAYLAGAQDAIKSLQGDP